MNTLSSHRCQVCDAPARYVCAFFEDATACEAHSQEVLDQVVESVKAGRIILDRLHLKRMTPALCFSFQVHFYVHVYWPHVLQALCEGDVSHYCKKNGVWHMGIYGCRETIPLLELAAAQDNDDTQNTLRAYHDSLNSAFQ
jgi:hypothetical protein